MTEKHWYNSPGQALLFSPGLPAVITKCLVSKRLHVNAQRSKDLSLIIEVKQVGITFVPGFPDEPSSPSLPGPPCKTTSFLHQDKHITGDTNTTRINASYKRTRDNPGSPGFPSGPCGERSILGLFIIILSYKIQKIPNNFPKT